MPDCGFGRPRTVAIVGSRKLTDYGKEVAYGLSYALARAGAVVVSGLAYGVDAVAHRAALDAGGVTVAVLGTCLAEMGPSGNRQLGEEMIARGGCVMTEYDEDCEVPARARFVERNRLVSGLADVVVVVEAALGSGSLTTARWACKQGRRLLAVPGMVTSAMSAGCNRLIAGGAEIVTSIEEAVRSTMGVGPERQGATLGGSMETTMDVADMMRQGSLAELGLG
jgi:DNA processing protein